MDNEHEIEIEIENIDRVIDALTELKRQSRNVYASLKACRFDIDGSARMAVLNVIACLDDLKRCKNTVDVNSVIAQGADQLANAEISRGQHLDGLRDDIKHLRAALSDAESAIVERDQHIRSLTTPLSSPPAALPATPSPKICVLQ